jgi:hypothetical protein
VHGLFHLEVVLISAEAYIEARDRGMSHEEAMASLPPYVPYYINRVPLAIYCAVLISRWKVFPAFNAEQARCPRELLHLATSDIEAVKSWATFRPEWAVATGPEAGLLMLEVSGVTGLDSLLSLCQDDWDWIDTIRVMNGSRRQIFFGWPEGYVQKTLSGPLATGLRLYGGGECVLLPSWRTDRSRDFHYFLTPCNSLLSTPSWLREFAFELECTPSGLLIPGAVKSESQRSDLG